MIVFESNIDVIEAKIRKYQSRLNNKKDIHKKLGQKEKERTRERIRVGKVNPDGVPWAMWAASTAASRARKGTTARGILYDTGNLLNSINMSADRDSFKVGTNVDYAEYHQYGAGPLPKREFLGFNDQIEQDAEWVLGTIFR